MFFRNLTKKKATLIVDIGSSSVGAALVAVSKGDTPKILFSTRSQVVLYNEFSKKRSLSRVIRTLESVMQTIMAEHVSKHIKIKKTHVFLSAPWYFSKTNVIKIDREISSLVTEDIIKQLISAAERKFIAESGVDGKVVESRIIHAKLNGYETTNLYNKKAKKIEIAFFATVVAKDVLEATHRVIGKHFHLQNNEVSSFPLAAFSTISGIFPKEHDFTIVDVRGEATDISLVSNGDLIKNLQFPQGKNALIQTIVDKTRHSLASALSLVSLALSGNSNLSTKLDVMVFAENFKQIWEQTCVKTLQEISAETSALQKIFLIADPDVEIFFEEILGEVKNNSKLHVFKHLNLRKYVAVSSAHFDPFLALEAIFVTMI